MYRISRGGLVQSIQPQSADVSLFQSIRACLSISQLLLARIITKLRECPSPDGSGYPFSCFFSTEKIIADSRNAANKNPRTLEALKYKKSRSTVTAYSYSLQSQSTVAALQNRVYFFKTWTRTLLHRFTMAGSKKKPQKYLRLDFLFVFRHFVFHNEPESFSVDVEDFNLIVTFQIFSEFRDVDVHTS